MSATEPFPPGTAADAATEWALRARDGDPLAQAAFVRGTQVEVWRYCAALTSVAEADDLTQETYLRAFRALPGFAARSSARTWLLAIARNTCADHLRAVVRRRKLDALLTHNLIRRFGRHPAHTPDPADTHGTHALLAGLSEERRAAFVLTQVIGLSYEETARIEGVAVGTIRSRVARARDQLVELASAAAAA